MAYLGTYAAGIIKSRILKIHILTITGTDAAVLDDETMIQDPASTSPYAWITMAAASTPRDCARLCCGDWSCVGFAFVVPGGVPSNATAGCPSNETCCILKDDLDALVPKTGEYSHVTTGVRAKLPARAPPFARSEVIRSATIQDHMYIAASGDEWPTTWADNGAQYTGAGDNFMPNNWNITSSSFL